MKLTYELRMYFLNFFESTVYGVSDNRSFAEYKFHMVS